MKLDWRNLLLGLIGLGMIGFVVLPSALYSIGNWTAPESPAPVTAPLPPLLHAAIWARANGRGEPHVEPLTPWSLFGFVTCNLAAEPRSQAQAKEARVRCLEDQAGVILAGEVSRLYTTTLLGTPRYPLSQVATMARLTREWDVDTLLSTVAAKSPFGQHKWIGIDQAGQAFFGKQPGQLTAAEAALLSVQIPNPSPQDPWCHPERARTQRDVVLKKMQNNGALTADSLQSAVNAPLGVTPGECSPR
ncbi:MAG: transglycosylase domain-containing protein [Vicinamibacterales bacterium]